MPINGTVITDIAMVTDAVVNTVSSAAGICLVYPVNLVIGIIVFFVGFGVVRRVLRR